MGIQRVFYIPKTLGELADQFAGMATDAPEYKGIYDPIYEPHDGPAGEFAATRKGLANVRSKLGERGYEYLLARIEENWARLQTGDTEDLRQLKLSFGEMIHFLRTKQYKAADLAGDWAEHTEVR
ncbi:hypothetical protein [uncultured Sphingomonas sp.]|uniref:hypothetical protein n=1 Tax=uncultured Sphingomonas sp. TaxID=158754 RepID=UPI0035CAAF56